MMMKTPKERNSLTEASTPPHFTYAYNFGLLVKQIKNYTHVMSKLMSMQR